MNLIHYSRKPLEKLNPVTYLQKIDYKPGGLWISDEDDYGWGAWCNDNQYLDTENMYKYKIILSPISNILLVNNIEKLLYFSTTYSKSKERFAFIDWPEVAKIWDGIIISPYIWECRFDPFWYYGWDCASGCIWNLSAILQSTLDPESYQASR